MTTEKLDEAVNLNSDIECTKERIDEIEYMQLVRYDDKHMYHKNIESEKPLFLEVRRAMLRHEKRKLKDYEERFKKL